MVMAEPEPMLDGYIGDSHGIEDLPMGIKIVLKTRESLYAQVVIGHYHSKPD